MTPNESIRDAMQRAIFKSDVAEEASLSNRQCYELVDVMLDWFKVLSSAASLTQKGTQ